MTSKYLFSLWNSSTEKSFPFSQQHPKHPNYYPPTLALSHNTQVLSHLNPDPGTVSPTIVLALFLTHSGTGTVPSTLALTHPSTLPWH